MRGKWTVAGFRLLLLGIVFLGCTGGTALPAAPEPVTIVPVVPVVPGVIVIGRHLELFEDPSARLTIDDIRTPARLAQFQPSSSERPYIGFTRSAWWATFTVGNPTDQEARPIVKFGYPIIDRLEFYRPGSVAAAADGADTYRVQITGDSVGERDQDLPGRYHLYRLSIPPGEARRYFVRISGDSPLALDVCLLGSQAAIEDIADRVRPLVLGALGAAIAFSLAIYVVLRDRVYLIFALFVLAVILYQAAIDGYFAAYIWPRTSWPSNLMALGGLCLIAFSVARFTSAYLSLKQRAPLTYRILCIVQIGSVAAFLLSFIDYHSASYLIIADMTLAVVASLVVSARLWRSSVRHARLYALCWLLFCFYAAMAMFQKLGAFAQTGAVDIVTETIIAVTSIFIAMIFTDRFKRATQANEQQLQKARDAAIAASRAKSKFLATMSHELRTPLNAIIGFSEVLTSETLGPLGNKKYWEYANDIRESGRHLLHVINDVLEISRVEAEQIELDEQAIILSDLIRRCLRLVEERARVSNIVLRKHLNGPLPNLHGDETRIQQVLINLLHNAIKFTPSGGSVTLEAGVTHNGEFRFAVIDTGIGIAAEDKERILDPFTQIAPHLTRHHGGVGLGLSIAKSIVVLHQGRLEVHSAPGKGSTFAVYFPGQRVVP